jgi:Zn-finger nucleic acid-binding protein
MSKLETRHCCPVCLGVPMGKITLSHLPDNPSVQPDATVLDYCLRCHGLWFDAGEVPQLRRQSSDVLFQRGLCQGNGKKVPCHGCHGLIDRNASHCANCGRHNQIDCPVCEKPMDVLEQGGLKLDRCPTCEGIWLDAIELPRIWQRVPMRTLSQAGEIHPGLPRKQQHSPEVVQKSTRGRHALTSSIPGEAIARMGGEVGATIVQEVGAAAIQHPGALAEVSGEVAAGVVKTLPELAETSAELVVTAIELSGEAAGAVVEVIVQVIGGVLGG